MIRSIMLCSLVVRSSRAFTRRLAAPRRQIASATGIYKNVPSAVADTVEISSKSTKQKVQSARFSRNEYLQTVTGWLDEENIAWKLQDSRKVFPKSLTTSHPILQLNPSSTTDLYLHLLKSPHSTKDCVAPTLTRDMTNYIQFLNREQNTTISLIHLHQDVWNSKTDICQSRLRMRLGRLSSRMFARKTQAKRIDAPTAMAFLQQHHLWSATKARYYYGLYFQEELVAVATFSSRRRLQTPVNGTTTMSNRSAFELLRFCTRRGETVVGAISKLLKAFIRDQQPDDIVTVVDRDWGPGEGWHSVGFQTLHVMAPVVMLVGRDGLRRHLVGAGIKPKKTQSNNKQQSTGRLGVEPQVLEELAHLTTHEQALQCLQKHDYAPVYDAGVERLHMAVSQKAQPQDKASDSFDLLWKMLVSSYAPTYSSPNSGIRVLMAHVVALTASSSYGTPMSQFTIKRNAETHDSSVAQGHTAAWKATGGTARNATLVYAAPSSMDPPALIEVRKRPCGWCILGIVGGATKSIYHGNYKVDADGRIDGSVLVSEYLRTMAALALVGLEFRQEADSNLEEDSSHNTPSFLYLGYGAGSLPRFMANLIPGSRHVAIELDEGVVQAARHCHLLTTNTGDGWSSDTGEIQLQLGDALTYQRPTMTNPASDNIPQNNQKDFFDFVFVDIFDGKNECPKDFYSEPFLEHVHQNLLGGRTDGMIIHNFHSGGKVRRAQLEDAIQGYRSKFATTLGVESVSSNPTGGNTVLLSRNQRRLDASSETLSWQQAGRNAQRRWGTEFDVAVRSTHKLWLT